MQMSSRPARAGSRRKQLASLRRKVFTGRAAELRLLRELMLDEQRGCFVVWLHGMGGVGKSTLLQRFGDEAEDDGRICRTVDMRTVEPTPEAFLASLRRQGQGRGPGRDEKREAGQDQGDLRGPDVLLVDSGELLGPLEHWLRHEFLPGLPADALLVVASRRPPAAEWRTDPQWWHALRSVRLCGMDDAEAALLLRNRQVPSADIPAVVRAAHGLPLALALFADALARTPPPPGQGRPWELGDAPDVVGEMLRLLLRETPTLAQSDALYVLALARTTTEELVQHTLDLPRQEARQLCAWLRRQSWVDSTGEGLVPHPLVRDALVADLRWRGTDKYERLFTRVHDHLTSKLLQHTGDRWSFGAGLAYLGRQHPAFRAAFDWRHADTVRVRPAHPEERDTVLGAVAHDFGTEAERLAAQWWRRRPASFTVVEDPVRGVVGTLVAPCVEPDATDLPDDPVVTAAREQLALRAPLRRSERLLVARWMTHDHESDVGCVFALLTLWAKTPGLSVSLTCVPERRPALSAALALHGQRQAAPVTDVDGQRVVPRVHDWRPLPFPRWSTELRARLLADDSAGGLTPEVLAEPPMPWPEFSEAVKQGYRNLLEPGLLAENALLSTRLVPAGSDASALREVLTDTVAQLRSSPGRQELGDVLELTYVSGPRSQQAAANRAALSFSTYRRRLSTALNQAAELLRERATYGAPD